MSSWNTELLPLWQPPSHTEHSVMTLSKSSEDNRTISQHMLKQTFTLTIKDQDTPIPGITLTPQQSNLLNSSKLMTPTIGSSSSENKTLGRPTKEEYTMDYSSAGGSNQTLSTQTTHFTHKRPASLLPLQQLPQHFSSFLPAPTPQIIQPQWKDNRKKLMSLLAKPSKKRRGLTSSVIPLTALSKETLHSCLMETETRPASSFSIGTYGQQSTKPITPWRNPSPGLSPCSATWTALA